MKKVPGGLTDERFAKMLLKEVVGESMAFYARQLPRPVTDSVTDPLWRALQGWAAGLPVEKRSLVLAFARQSAIDAISHVLGILDGTSGLPGAPGQFRLHYGGKSTPLTGDLQDYFLGAVEDAGADRWLRRALARRTKAGRKRRQGSPRTRTVKSAGRT